MQNAKLHVKRVNGWFLTGGVRASRVASINFQEGARPFKRCKTLKIWSINLPNNTFSFTIYLLPGELQPKDKYLREAG